MLNISGDLCGFIYVTTNKSFIYYCKFCENLFEYWQEFQDHNITEHSDNNLQKEVDFNFKNISSPTATVISISKEIQDDNILEIDENLQIIEELALNDDNSNATSCTDNSKKNEFTKIDEKTCELKDSEDRLESKNCDQKSNSQISVDEEQNFRFFHQCTFCTNKYSDKSKFDEHVQNHLNNSVACQICGKNWKTKAELERHYCHKKMHFEIKCDNGNKDTENSDGEIEFGEIEKLDSDAEIFELRDDKRQAENSGDECDTPISNNHLSNEEDNLSCIYCFKQYSMKTCLNEHIKNHLNFKLSCDICGKHFKVKNQLQRHKTSHLRVKCVVCEYSCWPDQLNKHMRTHENEDENHRCSFYRQKFSNKANLDEHTKRHFNDSLTCEICGAHFKRNNVLMNHKKNHLKKKIKTYAGNAVTESELAEIRELEKKSELKDFSNETMQNENTDKGLNLEISFFYQCSFCNNKYSDKSKFDEHVQNHLNNSLACDICGKHCKTKGILQRHKTIHLRIKCSLCEYRCLPVQLDEHMEKHKQANEDESLRCTLCHQKFTKKSSLDEHTKLHLNYILTCKICGKHCSNQNKIWQHKKTHLKKKCSKCNLSVQSGQFNKHMRDHKIQCKYCNKIFKKPYLLNTHMKMHAGEKPYKCTECPLAFVEKGNLNNHMLTQHTGDEKNFTCESCQRKFKTKRLHDLHYKRVHLKEKPHVCEFCGCRFASSGHLLLHKRKHHMEYDKRRYSCNMCDKKFVELQTLTVHMNTHTGEKPFQCEICSKSFANKNSLRSHKIIHSGEKKHACKICGKAYFQRSSCNLHMKQHHMIAPFTNVQKM